MTDGRDNRLVASLGPDAYDRLEPHLRRVVLRHRQVLFEPEDEVTTAYFPVGAVVSMLVVLKDGRQIELVPPWGAREGSAFPRCSTMPGRSGGRWSRCPGRR